MPTPQRTALTTLLLFLAACTDTPTSSPPNPAVLPTGAASGVSSDQLDQPIAGLSQSELARFNQGRAVFERVFNESTGLGPLFNEASCAECHEDPATGGFGDEVETHVSNGVAGACDDLGAHGGVVIQQHITDPLATLVGLSSEPVPSQASVVARRATPEVFGRGFLDAVTDAEILSRADPNDANHDGVKGHAHVLADGTLGRFGRKATDASLLGFNAGAFLNEMGITNPLALTEPQLENWPYDSNTDPVGEPELSASDLALANDFVRFLRVPPSGPITSAANDGRQLFSTIGCATCHVPTLTTGPSTVKALSNKSFAAFTDLLLHDMGGNAANDICRGGAGPTEFRTEPLVGVRFKSAFMHDGQSFSLEAAITRHAGEALSARDKFAGLKASQRSAVLAYLATL